MTLPFSSRCRRMNRAPILFAAARALWPRAAVYRVGRTFRLFLPLLCAPTSCSSRRSYILCDVCWVPVRIMFVFRGFSLTGSLPHHICPAFSFRLLAVVGCVTLELSAGRHDAFVLAFHSSCCRLALCSASSPAIVAMCGATGDRDFLALLTCGCKDPDLWAFVAIQPVPTVARLSFVDVNWHDLVIARRQSSACPPCFSLCIPLLPSLCTYTHSAAESLRTLAHVVRSVVFNSYVLPHWRQSFLFILASRWFMRCSCGGNYNFCLHLSGSWCLLQPPVWRFAGFQIRCARAGDIVYTTRSLAIVALAIEASLLFSLLCLAVYCVVATCLILNCSEAAYTRTVIRYLLKQSFQQCWLRLNVFF